MEKGVLQLLCERKGRNSRCVAESEQRTLVHSISYYYRGTDSWRHVSFDFASSLILIRWNKGESLRSMSSKAEVDKRKRKIRELQLIRRRAKMRKAQMNEEEKLIWRLEKAKRKAALLEQRLKKYELPEDPESVHDPEMVSSEHFLALKKIGYKNKNYVTVGKRGIYGGVVQNMHLHWKKHETVQIHCGNHKKPEVIQMAKELATLSGGIVIDIQGTIVIMYRGRNYNQPRREMIPANTLTKRRALFKSKYMHDLGLINVYINNVENELESLHKRKEIEAIEANVSPDALKEECELGGNKSNMVLALHGEEKEGTSTFHGKIKKDDDMLASELDAKNVIDDNNRQREDRNNLLDGGRRQIQGKRKNERIYDQQVIQTSEIEDDLEYYSDLDDLPNGWKDIYH